MWRVIPARRDIHVNVANELFACYGTDRRAAGVRFEDPQPRGATTGFVDAIFDEVAIIEMKKPGAAGSTSTATRR